MKLYHGSGVNFKYFDIRMSGVYRDFGVGIYLTDKLEHAERVALSNKNTQSYVYTYDININNIRRDFGVREFRSASVDWARYIVRNRSINVGCDCDMVIGPTADVRVQLLVNKYASFLQGACDSTYRDFLNKIDPKNSKMYSIFGRQFCVKYINLLNLFNRQRIGERRLR